MTGKQIYHLRGRFDLTQTALSHMLGVGVMTVNRWESGDSEAKGLPLAVLRAMSVGIEADPRLPTKLEKITRVDEVLYTIFAAACGRRGLEIKSERRSKAAKKARS